MLEIKDPQGLQKVRLRSASMLSSVGRLVGLSQTQLVVCGFPRGGTSLLYNMLSASLPHFRFESFEKYFIHRIHKLGNIGTKAPLDALHLPHIDKLNINNKKLIILIVVRDIRDVITSIHPIYNKEYFIGYDYSWWPQDKAMEEWKYDAPGVIPIHNAIQEVCNRPDTMIVRYEDLVDNPNKEQEKIKARFELSFDQEFSDYHYNSEKHAYRYQGRQAPSDSSLVRESSKVTRSRVSRWSNTDDSVLRVISQFSQCEALFDVLMSYGYERNRRWFEKLSSGSGKRGLL